MTLGRPTLGWEDDIKKDWTVLTELILLRIGINGRVCSTP
jgi:hypothetical protein